MQTTKTFNHSQLTMWDAGDSYKWVYKRRPCTMKELDCTETEAMAYIKKDLATPRYARDRCVKFKPSMLADKEDMVGMSHPGKRNLVLFRDIEELLAPFC